MLRLEPISPHRALALRHGIAADQRCIDETGQPPQRALGTRTFWADQKLKSWCLLLHSALEHEHCSVISDEDVDVRRA